MAEKMTPNGLVVGLIPEDESKEQEKPEEPKPEEKKTRGRKPKEA